MRRYSIQNKIVLPFILLFTVVVLIVPVITIVLFDQKYDEQNSLETQKWVQAIVDTGYIHQPEKVKEAYGAEVTVVSSDNTVNYTTLPGDWASFADEMKLHEIRKRIKESSGNLVSQNVVVDGRHYKVIYYLQEYDRLYCLMRPMDKIADAKRDVTLLMLGIAAVVILLVGVISHLIGRNLANPIKDLVQFTRKVAGGDLNEQCEVKTHDEIGDLTVAFNQMTRDLRNSRNELISAERLATAGKMAASFAHEIRNPLSSMQMLAQMLMRTEDLSEARRKQSMQYILEEIERIDVIVKGFMDFARPASLRSAPHDLSQALQEVLDLMDANLNHHQISLIKKFTPNLPPISLDRDKLKQAFMNIVLNAMEAMPEGGTLEILTMRQIASTNKTNEVREFASGDSDKVRIDVVDTGIGIPPEDLNRLFEPFFTTKSQGTGLGLANAKRVLEQHGGDIQSKSVVGQGTTMSLWLPLPSNPSPSDSKNIRRII